MKKIKPDIGHLVSTQLVFDSTPTIHLTGIIIEKYGIRVRIMVSNNTMIWKRRDDVTIIDIPVACNKTTPVV